ncbi:MAG: saccharopine dehydrogenase NADP-binding domain-containing protein, partial [Bacteroidales bacterium]|nr:saccharopine dehydrogenase NADP-binding domain-containing protein [Bacteroidales bacterium]
MNKVLILGAGLVSKPMIEYLLENGFQLTVASPMLERAEQMISGNSNGKAVDWSMDRPEELDTLVSSHDLTVSLLPYRFHVEVAKVCIRHRKHLVTTSYVQAAMQKLDGEAKDAGIIILNESGLDPGIDHMSAMRIIDTVKSKGGKIEEFYSLCGALPAPEAADNPLGYKFSWSPKGVVLDSSNGAQYLKKSEEVIIEAVNLFKARFPHTFPGLGKLEVYPNRDSISYIDIYGLEGIKT